MASDHGRETGEKRRRERLAAALRENLKRRKTQQRSRSISSEAEVGHSTGGETAQDHPPPSAGREF
jgi:hypothetical protein